MRSVVMLLASTVLLVLASSGTATAAPINGTISGTMTFDGSSTGSIFGNVLTGTLTRSGHVTLMIPGTSAEFDPASRTITRLKASATVAADYSFESGMSDPTGMSADGDCTRTSRYFERGPVTGSVEVQATADAKSRLSFSFGEKAETYTVPAVSEASSSTNECYGSSAPGGQAGVLYGGLGACRSMNQFGPTYAGSAALATRQLRKIGEETTYVWVIKGALNNSCATPFNQGQSVVTLDLVFTPGADAPTETPDRSMGLVCGKAGSDWRTVARQKTFVDMGERACVFLVGNTLAKEVLGTSVKTGGAFANRFGKTLLVRFGPQIAKDAAPEVAAKAMEIAIKRAGYKHLAKTAPLYYNAFKTITWQVRIGDAVALQAVPLSALFATSQIKSRKACVQVIARIEKKRLLVTSSLVYSPSALKNPARDRELTRAKVYYKQKRRLRTDLTERAYAGLSCDSKGQVRTSSVSSKAFRNVDVQIAGSGG